MRTRPTSVLCLAALLVAAEVRAQDLPVMDPQAKERLDRGVLRYTAKEYDAAIVEFRAGYAIEPRREFLFAWAQAERLRGNCAAATPLYRKVLAGQPSVQQREITRLHLERCRQLLPRPWYTDVVGDVLTLSGAGALAAGIGLYVVSARAEQDAAGATIYDDYAARVHTARVERAVGITGLVLGGALIVGGVVRYALRGRGGRARAALSISPGGLVLGGSF